MLSGRGRARRGRPARLARSPYGWPSRRPRWGTHRGDRRSCICLRQKELRCAGRRIASWRPWRIPRRRRGSWPWRRSPRAGLDALRMEGDPAVLLVLDAVQDPGNFGTLARTAEALGAAGLVTPAGNGGPVEPQVRARGHGQHLSPSRRGVGVGRAGAGSTGTGGARRWPPSWAPRRWGTRVRGARRWCWGTRARVWGMRRARGPIVPWAFPCAAGPSR